MSNSIHPTAYVESGAILAENVCVGPFAVVEAGARIGAGSRIGAHAVVHGQVKMGADNILHPHSVLGGLPQDTGFRAETESWLEIGDGNVFREGFTAHRATKAGAATIIGSGCYFMNNSHVAHDCRIGDKTIFANNVAIGGHVEVGANVFMGGAVVVHQFCRIGAYAIVQGTTGINMDVIPFTLIGGRPAKHYRLNIVGLRRAGIVGDRYKVLSAAFRLLRNKKSLDELQSTEELQYLKDWLAAESKRGMHGFMSIASTDNE
ncbi:MULTISPECIES: acyl-ACP--UDP-N-acetylglucosamine O-acyltransferase [Methylomonas]|uniref:Acyl-[acyl-carrier-protein]--UDP-N-acetylglucosamine O-acyltransferase n=1 Tax=Methylomonas koyamae TaxID=702114 RepID=A0A177NRX2_9GAMM|nr:MULTISPECIES: acyl-ACP--UDP-N-acetylglucosamine O-acyltransferase [Methylomonas]ANE54570.1 acyl-[acyl-carrier-protein]--UDP-N-acetylglucosamine O-acyltransferase [Methylomonas sp. DH-1]OAI20294.1 acyl-[acyl-carrier-protein]--UDP-N-acetylglucosamine O-acyltransferase [Methylomonas koyamae]WNB76877.1 acyl-ACP--UDP-N-acetylglucosamine O-acyltransferase [Methylomonas koyamae]